VLRLKINNPIQDSVRLNPVANSSATALIRMSSLL